MGRRGGLQGPLPHQGPLEMHNKLKILLAAALSVIIVDQATKAVIAGSLDLNEVVEVIPGFFNIVYFKNPGAAFGIMRNAGALKTVFLSGVTIVALVVIGALIRQSRDAVTTLVLSLVAGGAVGNLVDRVRFGYVVDFLDLYVGAYHWPAFNVADSAITSGVITLVFLFSFKHPKD